ncbi:hypothetical protein [Spiroplasma ixodetis]|uniref:Uncharacterized protein n=1 Tax=Spiroplasma ixodetis TaxID=2141 RepID=A0ABM8JLS8_9MOLU
MNFENLKKLKNEQFYRYFGIKSFNFDEILTKLIEIENLKKLKVENINFKLKKDWWWL